MSLDLESQEKLYRMELLRSKGLTYKQIAKELGTTSQNLFRMRKLGRGHQTNFLIQEILSYETTDPKLKDLLQRTTIALIRLTETVKTTMGLANDSSTG